jgi:multiple sugar transport system permease protein
LSTEQRGVSLTAFDSGGVSRSAVLDWLDRRTAVLMVAPAVLIVLGVALAPAVASLWLSLQDRSLSGGSSISFVGLANYRMWLADPSFWNAMRISVVFTVSSVLLQLLIGLGVALLLHRGFPGRNLLRALVLIPWVLPIVSTANIWVWMFNEIYGTIDTTLVSLRLTGRPIPWLSSPQLSLLSVIIVKTWREFPFAALLLMAGLQTISSDLYEAAKMDGANGWQRFRHVTLPGLKLIILIILLMQTIWTFNDLSTVYLTTRGGPGTSSEVLPILIYRTSFVSGDLSRGAAGAVLMFIVVASLAVIYFRGYVRSERENWR